MGEHLLIHCFGEIWGRWKHSGMRADGQWSCKYTENNWPVHILKGWILCYINCVSIVFLKNYFLHIEFISGLILLLAGFSLIFMFGGILTIQRDNNQISLEQKYIIHFKTKNIFLYLPLGTTTDINN
jgi:hypothetical protein